MVLLLGVLGYLAGGFLALLVVPFLFMDDGEEYAFINFTLWPIFLPCSLFGFLFRIAISRIGKLGVLISKIRFKKPILSLKEELIMAGVSEREASKIIQEVDDIINQSRSRR